MRKLRHAWHLVQGELRASSPLISLAVLSVLTVIILTQGSVTLAYSSFQSPESPIQSPAATPAPSEVPPEEPPVATATPPQAPPEQPPAESPVAPPPEVPAEVETPFATPQATSEQTAIGVTPVPTVEGEEASPTGGVSWAVLIDTLVVGLSSVWLCCGGLALVLFVLGVIATFLLRAT